MAEIKDRPYTVNDMTAPQAESTEPAYRAWKKAKVTDARAEAEDRSKMIPAGEIWQEFGLES